jgi:transforming acidic coiled-coil-containing protein 3
MNGNFSFTPSSAHQNEDFGLKMADMENKIKKDAELREENLLKRISEKDKQISKMKYFNLSCNCPTAYLNQFSFSGVVEAYEKAISELIAEKEQVMQSYEKKCNDLKSDSELNANHLASLESTFSDLHA